MAYIGKKPAAAPLTSSDVTDDIITLAKMAGGTDGNIITYDASGDPAVVATGSDGQVLTSTGAGSPPAFEALSAGKFLQIQTAGDDTSRSTTSTSFVTASNTLEVDITPASTSNKILVCLWYTMQSGTYSSTGGKVTIYRDGSNMTSDKFAQHKQNPAETIFIMQLDDPQTTSEVTYQVYFNATSGNTSYLNSYTKSTIFAIEIGA